MFLFISFSPVPRFVSGKVKTLGVVCRFVDDVIIYPEIEQGYDPCQKGVFLPNPGNDADQS